VKDMRDFLTLQSNHSLPDPVLEEDQEAQQPLVVDVVYNTHETQNGKTVAVTVSLQLPNACRCPHCEVLAPLPRRSRTATRQEA
jgi:hypothetical protein